MTIRHQLQHAADVIVQLRADGTYQITKDRNRDFKSRDEEVYGIRYTEHLKQPNIRAIVGRMGPNGVFNNLNGRRRIQ